MVAITDAVKEFSPISLQEMDSVKLMNRVDTKYIVSSNRIAGLLAEVKENYRILEIENQRELIYRTTYFDTPDYQMYTAHQNGKLNRFKIRTREYVVSNIHFLEVKFKNNKGRTLKERVKRSEGNLTFESREADFLHKSSPFSGDALEPKLWNSFTRLTLVHKKDLERITIDFNLSFKNGTGTETNIPNLAIIEAKQDKYTASSDFLKVLKRNQIYAMRVSKYCIGSAILNPELKRNSFKNKLMAISKLN